MKSAPERDWAYLESYVRLAADQMNLRHWQFHLSREQPENKDADASAEIWGARYGATFRWSEGFRTQAAVEQRETVVHELLHCHSGQQREMIRNDLVKWLGQAVYEVVYCAYARLDELTADALSAVIAPHLPLPEWPKDAEPIAEEGRS